MEQKKREKLKKLKGLVKAQLRERETETKTHMEDGHDLS
jgi:hypothetical protein